MHGDIKVFQQLLMNDRNVPSDALANDGSSILGKYIIGAKNNFRGFNSEPEYRNTSLKVTVHNGEEEVNKEEDDSKMKSKIHQNRGECETEQGTDCDVVKMEEGRAKPELGQVEETENKEEGEADENENTDSKLKEEEIPKATSFDYEEETVNTEVTQDQVEVTQHHTETIIEDKLTGEEVGEIHIITLTEQDEAITVSESTDTKTLINKFRDLELQEQHVDGRWLKGGKTDHNGAEQSDVREGYEKLEAKKTIPSPSGSSSSQDTGFGSQEGEGSIDGILVRM